jgi:hypothetical protein
MFSANNSSSFLMAMTFFILLDICFWIEVLRAYILPLFLLSKGKCSMFIIKYVVSYGLFFLCGTRVWTQGLARQVLYTWATLPALAVGSYAGILFSLRKFLSISSMQRLFIIKLFEYFQKLFSIYSDDYMKFFYSVYVDYYINWLSTDFQIVKLTAFLR